MSQGARTRNFMLSPHNSLRTPREASPAFRLQGHGEHAPRPVISDRAVCIGAALSIVAALLIVNLT